MRDEMKPGVKILLLEDTPSDAELIEMTLLEAEIDFVSQESRIKCRTARPGSLLQFPQRKKVPTSHKATAQQESQSSADRLGLSCSSSSCGGGPALNVTLLPVLTQTTWRVAVSVMSRSVPHSPCHVAKYRKVPRFHANVTSSPLLARWPGTAPEPVSVDLAPSSR